MHLRIEVGRWWLQIGRQPDPQPETSQTPAMVVDHPQPMTVYTPEQGVGFYRLPDETDRGRHRGY